MRAGPDPAYAPADQEAILEVDGEAKKERVSGWLVGALVVGVLVFAACFAIAWWDQHELAKLPVVDVDAEEELDHLRRREELHVVPHEPDPPYDWAREEKRL